MCARVLSPSRGRGEGDTRHQHSPLTCCVPLARLQDSAADISRAPSDRQVSPLHLHHEHCQYPRHGHHHQLELQRTQDSLHAQLDQSGVHQVSPNLPLHAQTQEDEVTLDDGDAGSGSL